MELGSLLGVLAAILAVTTAVAAGLAGLLFGTIRTLRESNQDLRDRVDDLERGRTEDRAKIAELRADNAALGRVVTGETYLVSLTDQLNTHQLEAREHWTRDEELLAQILTILQEAR